MGTARHLVPVGVALLLTFASAAACRRTEQGPPPFTLALQQIDPPAAINSAEPQLTSSPAGVVLSWLERSGATTTLQFVERTSNGWSAPRRVASGPGWFVSYADVPSVIRLSDGTLAANWLEDTDATIEAYDLKLSYSKDDGRTWAPPFTPHHDGTTTQHGFASLLELPTGGLGVLWLDGRDQELNTTDSEGGAMAVWYAAFDTTWKQTAEQLVNQRVCECCPTTAVVTSDGLLTAFRNRDPQEIRDIQVSRLEDGAWTASVGLHQDNWMIPACPVNGPMLSARDRHVAAAWFTVKDDQGQAYAAFSSDAGRTWGNPIRLDDRGSLGRVDVELLDDGSAVATWVEFADQRAQFKARRVYESGARSSAIEIAGVEGGRASGFPRVTRRSQELVFAWSASIEAAAGDGSTRVHAAVAPVPQ